MAEYLDGLAFQIQQIQEPKLASANRFRWWISSYTFRPLGLAQGGSQCGALLGIRSHESVVVVDSGGMFGTNKTLRNCPTSIKEEEIHLKTRERRRNPSEKPTPPHLRLFQHQECYFILFFGERGSIRTRSSFIILNWYHPRSNALKSESQKTWERSEPRAGGSGVRTQPLCYNRCQLIKSWFEIACWGHSV